MTSAPGLSALVTSLVLSAHLVTSDSIAPSLVTSSGLADRAACRTSGGDVQPPTTGRTAIPAAAIRSLTSATE